MVSMCSAASVCVCVCMVPSVVCGVLWYYVISCAIIQCFTTLSPPSGRCHLVHGHKSIQIPRKKEREKRKQQQKHSTGIFLLSSTTGEMEGRKKKVFNLDNPKHRRQASSTGLLLRQSTFLSLWNPVVTEEYFFCGGGSEGG